MCMCVCIHVGACTYMCVGVWAVLKGKEAPFKCVLCVWCVCMWCVYVHVCVCTHA